MTVDLLVAPGTLPCHLTLVLSKQRLTLRDTRRTSDQVVLRRQLYAKILPSCTSSWTMPAAQQTDEHAVVRIVLYKAIMAGWVALFADDVPGEHLACGPAPVRAGPHARCSPGTSSAKRATHPAMMAL